MMTTVDDAYNQIVEASRKVDELLPTTERAISGLFAAGNTVESSGRNSNADDITAVSYLHERQVEALELWREWFTKDGDPGFASEVTGDYTCFFCNCWIGFDEHEADCIYVRAKALVEDGE